MFAGDERGEGERLSRGDLDLRIPRELAGAPLLEALHEPLAAAALEDGRVRRSSKKLARAVRLAAADLLEPAVQGELADQSRGVCLRDRARLRRSMVRQSRAMLDDPHLVLVARLDDPELEAGYLPRSDVIVLTPELVRRGGVDDVREAILEEALHRCLYAHGLEDEDEHHRVIGPVLARARAL